MKKLLAYILGLVMVGSGTQCLAQTFVGEVLDEEEMTMKVTGGTGLTGRVTLPSTIMLGEAEYTVVEIAANAFDSAQMTSMTLPSTLTTIGEFAFAYCHNLTSIKIPDNVTRIDSGAFLESGLVSVVLPQKLDKVSAELFRYCSSLKSVVLPSAISEVGNKAFERCTALSDFYVGRFVPFTLGSASFTDVELSLVNLHVPTDSKSSYESKATWSSFGTIDDDAYVIYYTTTDGNALNKYNSEAFGSTVRNNYYSSGKGKLLLTDMVYSIGDSAFMNCTNLQSIELPPSVSVIGECAFWNCTSLNSMTIPVNIATVNRNPFANCTSLLSIQVEAGNQRFESVDGVLYSTSVSHILGCYPAGKLDPTYVVKADSKKVTVGAFMGNKFLQTLTFPDSTRIIGPEAFVGCTNLKDIYFGDSISYIQAPQFLTGVDEEDYYYIEGLHFKSKTTAPFIAGCCDFEGPLKLYIPFGCSDIYENYLYVEADGSESPTGWEDMMRLVVEEGYADSDSNETPLLYRYCMDWRTNEMRENSVEVAQGPYYSGNVVVPSQIQINGETYTVEGIGDYAFLSCNGLESISLPSTLKQMGWWVFYGTSLSELVLPEGLESMQPQSINYTNIESIEVPASMLYLNTNSLANRKLKSIHVADGNRRYTSLDGILYTIGKDTLLYIPENIQLTDITTPDETLVIDEYAVQTRNVKTFTTNASVIEGHNFTGCNDMKIYLNNSDIAKIDGYNLCANNLTLYLKADKFVIPESTLPRGYSMKLYVKEDAYEAYAADTTMWGAAFAINQLYSSARWNDNEEMVSEGERTYESLTVTINFTSSNWRTSCLPFAIPVSYFTEAEAEVYEYSNSLVDEEKSTVMFNFVKVYKGDVPANRPLLVKSSTSKSVTFSMPMFELPACDFNNNNPISTADVNFWIYNTNMFGRTSSTFPTNAYFMGGGKFGHISEGVSVPVNRWYAASAVANEPSMGASPYRLAFMMENNSNTTILSLEEAEPIFESTSYRLDGSRTSESKGLMIRNGKVIFVR